MILIVNATTYLLMGIACTVALWIFLELSRSKRKMKKNLFEKGDNLTAQLPEPPGPKPWPVFGSLHLFALYDVPYKAFGKLVQLYDSQVIKLRMGSVPCVVVNGYENIKEVLITKGHHFDSRPNFARYNLLFSGNKENSLAFCDWSDVQKSRRDMLKAHVFPRTFKNRYQQLNEIMMNHLTLLIDNLASKGNHASIPVKPLILATCGNIFLEYFTSRKFDLNHEPFLHMISNFDKVFYEVNQGYAADFIPFLLQFHSRNIAKMANSTREIREFVDEYVIGERFNNWQNSTSEIEDDNDVEDNKDYVDCLLNHVKDQSKPTMTWDMAMFALEDIIGGHSAIGNFLIKVMGFLATNPHVQSKAQQEIDRIELNEDYVDLNQRSSLPYMEAIIFEAIRLIASPIVPHVSNQDSSIGGYKIEKNTFIFLNNYDLNMSDTLWSSPQEFNPDRFVQNGKLSKPDYFLPFSNGRRSCMGFKLVKYISFVTLTNLLKRFTIMPVENQSYVVPKGNLALPEKTFSFRFEAR